MEKYTIVKSGKDYEVVEQYLYLSLLAAFGITKEKIKYKVATLRSIYPNKGGNYNNGHSESFLFKCKGTLRKCELYLSAIKRINEIGPLYLKTTSYFRATDTYYPCCIWTRNGGHWTEKGYNGEIKIYYSDLKRYRSSQRRGKYYSWFNLYKIPMDYSNKEDIITTSHTRAI